MNDMSNEESSVDNSGLTCVLHSADIQFTKSDQRNMLDALFEFIVQHVPFIMKKEKKKKHQKKKNTALLIVSMPALLKS